MFFSLNDWLKTIYTTCILLNKELTATTQKDPTIPTNNARWNAKNIWNGMGTTTTITNIRNKMYFNSYPQGRKTDAFFHLHSWSATLLYIYTYISSRFFENQAS